MKFESLERIHGKAPWGFQLSIDSIELREGEITFLHGPSGCGKTTLLELIAEKAAAINNLECSYIMHESGLFPWNTVARDYLLDAGVRGRPRNLRRFVAIMREFGLEEHITRRPCRALSLGMRQRLEIAKALSFAPKLILIDEGLSGIDQTTKQKVGEAILREASNARFAVLATAHQLVDVLRFGSRVIIMASGTVVRETEFSTPVRDRVMLDASTLLASGDAKGLLETLL